MAPSYANVFMGSLEDNFYVLTYGFGILPILIFIWTHGEKIVFDFRNKLNSFHPTIKFVPSHSTQEIIFLIRPFILTMIRTLNPTSILNRPVAYLSYTVNPTTPWVARCDLSTVRYWDIWESLVMGRSSSWESKDSESLSSRVVIETLLSYQRLWTGHPLDTQSQLLEPKEKNNISILPFVTSYDQNLFQLNHLL